MDKIISIVVLLFFLNLKFGFAQQDAQFTQYMYNTLSINPAYAGQRDGLSIIGMHRTQWVGIDGAPQTQLLGVHAPLTNPKLGLGLNVVNDVLGPSNEATIAANFSYTIFLNQDNMDLSFGLKAGWYNIRTDWSRGRFQTQSNPLFQENINLDSPLVGAGLYVSDDNWYLGFSIPNFFSFKYYNDELEALAINDIHYYIMGGYVIDFNENIKIKPAFMARAVSGAPIVADISGNVLFNDKLTLGLAWRWNDSVSGLAGFQVNDKIYIGYAYDMTSTNLSNYNSGSHEIMLRFEWTRPKTKCGCPRFF